MNLLYSKTTKVLKHRLHFLNKKKTQTIDTFPIIQGQKFLGTTVRFPYKEKMETMDTFTLIQGQKFVETMVRFSK